MLICILNRIFFIFSKEIYVLILYSLSRQIANFNDVRSFSDLFLPDSKGIVIGMQLIFLETGALNFIPIRKLLVPGST